MCVLYKHIFVLCFFFKLVVYFLYIYFYISLSASSLARATRKGTRLRNEQCDTCSESHPAFVAAGLCEMEVGLVCSIISGKFPYLGSFPTFIISMCCPYSFR